MTQKITTFLMFEGAAEEAMTFYTSLFDDAEILDITRYGSGGPGKEGTVQHATFSLAGQEYMAIDSSVSHGFTFTRRCRCTSSATPTRRSSGCTRRSRRGAGP